MRANNTQTIWQILYLFLHFISVFKSTNYKSFQMDPQKQEQVSKDKEVGGGQEKILKSEKTDKTYIKAKKKWKDFNIDENIIQALRLQNKQKPTKVQEQTMQIALDPTRKKFNLLVRAINGSGKTLAFLLPMICALEPGLKTAQDKTVRGKVMQKQVFKPQGIILIQNFLLQSQLNHYLTEFRDYGLNNNVDRLKFTIGVLNQDGHTPGDIIVCMPKSFLNRHERGNMKLDQCKFVAIDQIDQIYNFDKDSLAKILKIIKNERPNLIASSATMQKHFLKFYQDCDPDYTRLNLNADLQKQTGKTITLEGVKNFYHSIPCEKDKSQLHDFILKKIFKQLYGRAEVNKKPQVFIFFNSVDQIYSFDKKFEALASDFVNDECKYLQNLKRASIAAKTYKDGKKVDMEHSEKEAIMVKFKNSETNVLLCTNIMARGIDIRNAVFVINVGAPKKSDKDDIIDVDIYLHRVGRTGRHNDKGVALTLGSPQQIEKLVDGVKKIHKIGIQKLVSQKQIVDEVFECISSN